MFDTVLCSVHIMVGLDFDWGLMATIIQTNNNNSLRISKRKEEQNAFYA